MSRALFDEIGYWSEVKLAIVQEYASAYSRIMNARKENFFYIYIDAFAGSGQHLSRSTRNIVSGSPLNALEVRPSFKEYHFIDLEKSKTKALQALAHGHENVFIYNEDCNKLLLQSILPEVRYERFRRALCLLDPYGLDLNWEVVHKAGVMKTIEIFLNFPVMDMNRNVLWSDHEKVEAEQRKRMDAFWGDRSWHQAAYETQPGLFGDFIEKTSNEAVVDAYRRRLKEVAGFEYVPSPMPMRNSQNAVVYYLFFASQKPVAASIIGDIFKKYRNRSGTK